MNRDLEKIFKEDQKDRLDASVSPSFVMRRDKERRKQTQRIINENGFKTGIDYYHAAMIFHHSPSIAHIKKACALAEKSSNLSYKKAKWLCAATLDRLLMRQGKKQKFGTQFTKKSPTDIWRLYPVDSKTTDKERKLYNVPTLAKTKKMIEKMNQKNR